ncbi:glutathione S-transferase [Nitrobacteraceae bacterium AZCC 1564]
MERYYFVSFVTLLAGVMTFGMSVAVARAHTKTGILAPAMTGHPRLERAVRAHANTLEWMPIFLPALWLFAIYWSAVWAAWLGLVWIVGRIVYFAGYLSAPEKRAPGFFIQAMATFALLLGALGRIIYLMVSSGT